MILNTLSFIIQNKKNLRYIIRTIIYHMGKLSKPKCFDILKKTLDILCNIIYEALYIYTHIQIERYLYKHIVDGNTTNYKILAVSTVK